MKNNVSPSFVLSTLLIFLTFSSFGNLRITSFNIWDCGDYNWWQDRGGYPVDRVVQYLSEDHSDILLLQEVTLENHTPQIYAILKKKLEQKGYIYSAYYKPKDHTGYISGDKSGGYPLAILSKRPILETFSKQSVDNFSMAKGVLGVKINYHHSPIYVFTTHLGIGSPYTDNEVSTVLAPFIDHVTKNAPVILGGDWNSPSGIDFPKEEKKIGDYTYSYKTEAPLLKIGFQDDYRKTNPKINLRKEMTCPLQDDIIKRVDRIYSRNMSLKPIKAWTKKDLWEETIKESDHVAVVIEYR